MERSAWSSAQALLPSLVCSDMLRTIDLHIGPLPTAVQVACDLLACARQLSSNVEEIFMRGSTCPSTRSLLASMDGVRICHLKHDQSLRPSDILSLARFASLTELHIDGTNMNTDHVRASIESFSHDDGSDYFPALRSLRLSAPSQFIEFILEITTSRTLEHVHLDLQDRALSTAPWRTIFTLLGQKAAHSLRTLTALHILDAEEVQSDLASGPVPSDMTFTISDFRPLAPATSLQSFLLQSSFSTALRDAEALEMARWWPALQRLSVEWVQSEHAYYMQPHMTFAGLVEWAQYSPQLEHLVLSGCLSSGLPEQVNVDPQRALKTLSFGHLGSGIDSTAVAAYLHRLFPALAMLGVEEAGWDTVRTAYNRIAPGRDVIAV